MPSPTATAVIRAKKQEQYSNNNTWGPILNTDTLDPFDEAFTTVEVAVEANVTLSVANYVSDEARRLGIVLTGTGGFVVTAPANAKAYFIVNNCTNDNTFKPLGGTAATIRAGTGVWYYTTGSSLVGNVVDPTLDKIKAPSASVSLNSQKLINVAAATSTSDATTRANKITDFAAAGGSLNLNSNKIINVTDPTSAQDASTKAYVDAEIVTVLATTADDVATTNANVILTNADVVSTNADAATTNADVVLTGLDVIAAAASADAAAASADAAAASAASINLPAKVANEFLQVNAGATAYESKSATEVATAIGALTASDVGTGANDLVQLDGSAKLPAVDGSQLTGISASQTIYGTTTSLSSDATADFTLEAGADEWFFSVKNVIPATDNKGFSFSASDDGGSTFAVTTNTISIVSSTLGGPTLSASSGALVKTPVYMGSGASEYGASGTLRILPSSSEWPRFRAEWVYMSEAGNITHVTLFGEWKTTTTLTHIRFNMTGGNLESGEITPGYVSY
ncbi:hypothetical protein [Maritalea porphyrae]|uniref:hypothetical protein n=1 Tax=Maritalea porphyrae TaxID=880732 RepID=UPI0022AE54F8|nr:hypothetical protein [Maritalea porphyrae]MCZ4270893.1 hypothetical protein [Maritalea porphyrae]